MEAMEVDMGACPEPGAFQPDFPTTMMYCKNCQRETPHEIYTGSGVTAKVCIECLRRALEYDLERD